MIWRIPSLLSLAAGICLVSIASPGHGADLGPTVSEPGVFSYQAPKGWVIRDVSFSKYKVSFGERQDNFAANINVTLQTYPGSLSDYTDLNSDQLKASPLFTNLEIVGKSSFETSSGVKGMRVVAKDTLGKLDLQQVFYLFEGASDTKFVVTASCLVDDGDHYQPIFDASMKTFSPR